MQSNKAEFNAIEASLEQIKYNLKLIENNKHNDYNILTQQLEDFESRIKRLEDQIEQIISNHYYYYYIGLDGLPHKVVKKPNPDET